MLGSARGHEPRLIGSVPAALIGFTLTTMVMCWPQWRHLDAIPEHHDAAFNIWRLSWIAHQARRAPLSLFDANIFWPARNTLALSDAVPLQGAMAAPLLWSGVPQAVAYNLIVLASFPAIATGTFLLVRRLTGSSAAGWIAGLIVAFAPFRVDHAFHLELLWGCFIPLALWAYHRTLDSGRISDGLLTGACVAAQALSCLYYAVFLATLLVVLALASWAARLLRLRSRQAWALLVGIALAVCAIAPYGLSYVRSAREVGLRSVAETASYSATPVSYLTSPASNRLYGWTYFAWGGNEQQLFTGLTGIALLILALWPPFERRRLIYAACLIFAVDLSFGANGVSFGLLRVAVPLYAGLRVPARAGMLSVIMVAVLAGMGFARLLRFRIVETRRTAPGVLLGLLSGLILLEAASVWPFLVGVPPKGPPFAAWLRDEQPGVVLHLPVPRPDSLPGDDMDYQLASTFHWQTLVNGYSGAYPPGYIAFLESMRGFPDARSLAAIRASGASVAILHERYLPAGTFKTIDDTLRGDPALRHVTWSMDGRGLVSIYRVRGSSPGAASSPGTPADSRPLQRLSRAGACAWDASPVGHRVDRPAVTGED